MHRLTQVLDRGNAVIGVPCADLVLELAMTRWTTLLGATFVSLYAIPATSAADTLGKIRDTGVVTLGVRESGAPLWYMVGSNSYDGYHVELAGRCSPLFSATSP